MNTEWVLSSGPFTSGASNIGYGEAIAMEGNIMAVGAPRFTRGIVETRSLNTGDWETLNTLLPEGEANDFGASVDVSIGAQGVAMAVGAPTSLDTTGLEQPFGAAFYYELTGTSWTLRGGRVSPLPTFPTINGRFGTSVAVSAESRRMAVGGPLISLGTGNVRNVSASIR